MNQSGPNQSKPIRETDPILDHGAHYRFFHNGVQMDPYRIALVHEVTHPVAFHMMKKILRGGRKGHDERTLVNELQCCLDRWRNILDEDQPSDPQMNLPFVAADAACDVPTECDDGE